jgi:hypothetical protein
VNVFATIDPAAVVGVTSRTVTTVDVLGARGGERR